MGKWKKYVVLSGLMLINSVVNMGMFFGNLSTYIYSIHFSYHSPDSRFDIDPSSMLPAYLLSKALGNFIAHLIQRKVGLKYTSSIGVFLYIFSIGITYFTVRHSIWATTLTLMVAGGIGNSFVSVTNYIHVANWFPSKVGVASAVSASATAIGGAILNAVITTFINPGNLEADMEKDKIAFFSQRAIIDRVPWVFLVIAAVAFGFQVPGCLLLPKHPPQTSLTREESTSSSTDASATGKETQQRRETTQYTLEKGAHPNQKTDSASSCRTSQIISTTAFDKADKDNISDISSCDSDQQIEDKQGLPPLQVIKSEKYYILQFATIAISLGLIVSTNYFKLFGQLWIKDDHFMAFVASCSSLFCNIFLIGCGFLMDWLGNKSTLIAHLATSSFFMCLWYFTAQADRWLYLVWTVVIYSVHNNINILFSVTTMIAFGKRHFAMNMAIMQIGSVIVYIFGPSVVTAIIYSSGWFWLFLSAGSVSLVSLILVTLRLPSE